MKPSPPGNFDQNVRNQPLLFHQFMSTLIEVMTTWNKNGTPQKPVPTTKVLFRLNPNYDPVSPTKKHNDHLTIRGGTFSTNIMGI